jgi:hypothetical protein
MKHFPISVLAVALAAAAAPAQLRIEGNLGRHIRGVVNIGAGHEHRHDHRGPVSRGHWETVHEQVLVPGYWREEHVPPTYGWISDRCGHRHWGVVDAGGCRRVWVPDRWETRCRQVWVRC